MKYILKFRWLIITFWVVAATVLTIFLPNLSALINERGNVMLDSSYPSQVAKDLMSNLSLASGDTGILVFSDDNQLSSEDRQNIEQGLQNLKNHADEIGITAVTDIFDTPAAEDQLVSEDNTTMLVQFSFEKNGRDIEAIRADIENQLGTVSVTHYITGNDFISSEYVSQIMVGVERSALLTVAFILIVLILMFRSVVAPFASLVTVGVSYLVSIGIVGQLVDQFGFPISTLTQMFIILILFGIGTDYNILLFNRFKEEIQKQDTVDEAIIVTYKTAGKTILYSGITVFIAFLSLLFVDFGVYRSGVAVAIGVAILLAVLFTLVPALLKIVGKKLFWPSRNVKGHGQNKLWARATSLSVKRPYLAMIGIALVILPILAVGSYTLTFNNLKDMDNSSSQSFVGFNTVADHFGDGKIMPVTVVIASDTALDNSTDLAVIDTLTEKLRHVDGVASVSGPTQPQGEEIAELYTDNQTKQVVSGLSSANSGIQAISNGLDTMYNSLSSPDFTQVQQLAAGTSALQQNMGAITSALQQIKDGMDSGSAGAAQIAEGIATIRANLNTVSGTLNNQLLPGYISLKSGVDTWAGGYVTMEQNLSQLIQMAQGINSLITMLGDPSINLSGTNPAAYAIYLQLHGDGSASNPGLMPQLVGAMTQLDAGMKTANQSYTSQIAPNFTALNGGLAQVSGGLPQMASGLSSLESGATALSQGLAQGSAGQAQVISGIQTMSDALKVIADGQQSLSDGLSTFGSALTQLKDALGASRDGLNQISDGINEANSYLTELSSTKTFYLPEEALQNDGFQTALNAYMSADRKTAELLVTLEYDPYSDEAVQTVTTINTLLATSLDGSALSGATIATGGETSVTNDLKQVAVSDMEKTQLIVLISIFLVLIFVTRSFWIPVFITGSILLTYYSTISLTSLFAQNVLHTGELAWNVPFFAFLMIVTLGVDYSIFLMTRFRESRDLTPHEAIVEASGNVGGVVLSAALILGGTFATIIPTGVHTLVELAISVCIGILMLSVLFLPFIIPACISVQDWLTKMYGFTMRHPENKNPDNNQQD